MTRQPANPFEFRHPERSEGSFLQIFLKNRNRHFFSDRNRMAVGVTMADG